MAGRGQEEEEECEDCKLQTILRVNVFLSPLLETFAMVFALRTYPWALWVPRSKILPTSASQVNWLLKIGPQIYLLFSKFDKSLLWVKNLNFHGKVRIMTNYSLLAVEESNNSPQPTQARSLSYDAAIPISRTPTNPRDLYYWSLYFLCFDNFCFHFSL